ncbi:MAG: prolyl oligopeptidase family serine peptidase [Pirellulaceae bacterium]|nr:prolyl oligopeptidase family serine peptidase [Pirellulaceae bacterium]
MSRSFLLVLPLILFMPLVTDAADVLDRFEARVYKDEAGELPYRLLKPKDYDPNKKYPLVVFLHGAGERGNDNKRQLVHGMADFASDANMEKYPAFVLAPQCASGKKWCEVDWGADSHTMPEKPSQGLAATFAVIEQLQKELSIDPNRLYITGLSMGGYGTWDAIQRRPDLFAAAVPICGGGDPAGAAQMKDIPIWCFHGSDDTAVKVKRSRDMIKAIESAGGKPKYTEYPGVGHNSWSRTYADPAMFAWLFSQKKS